MLKQNKIIAMTKLAIYEKHKGEKPRRLPAIIGKTTFQTVF